MNQYCIFPFSENRNSWIQQQFEECLLEVCGNEGTYMIYVGTRGKITSYQHQGLGMQHHKVPSVNGNLHDLHHTVRKELDSSKD